MAKYSATVSGVTVTADSLTQLKSALQKLGYDLASLDTRKFYYSSTKGELLLIEEMHPAYLRNAILARYGEWLETLRSVDDAKFTELLEQGPQALLPLILELRRKNALGITSKSKARR